MRIIPSSLRRMQQSLSMVRFAILQRVQMGGFWSLLKDASRTSQAVWYVDVGLHKHARELKRVRGWFANFGHMRFIGFEAHPQYCTEAARELDARQHGIDVVNAALVGPDEGNTVTLNLNGSDGFGDSLFRKRTEQSLVVPALRLSDYLRKAGANFETDVILLRMNIEGAEVLVLKDLLSAGQIRNIDGYFGSWDDVFKIGGSLLQEYEDIAKQHQITHLSFNHRDLKSGMRRFAIRYHLNTCILAGARRKGAAKVTRPA